MKTTIKLGYLISQYPAPSHSFIFNEIQSLRKQGFEIHTASINRPYLPQQGMSELEEEEIARTFVVKNQSLLFILHSCLITLLRFPWGTLKGLYFVFKMGGMDLKLLAYHFFYLIEAMILGSWMRVQHLSHLHVHFGNAAASVALLASRMFGITYSMTIHGPDIFFDVTRQQLPLKVDNALFTLCIGHIVKSQLLYCIPLKNWEKCHFIPLGVDTRRFSKQTFYKEQPPLRILNVARLVPAKGHWVLLEACRLLKHKNRSFLLKIIGEGPLLDALQEHTDRWKLTDSVRFEGALNQSDVIRLYEEAQIYVSASLAEGIPIALMEAMAMEIPCVASGVWGIPELITHGREGLLVKPTDPSELADAIETLLLDSNTRKAMGQAARKKILEAFNLDTNTKRLGQFFLTHLPAISQTANSPLVCKEPRRDS